MTTSSIPKHSVCSLRHVVTTRTFVSTTGEVMARAADGSSSRTALSRRDVVGIS